jgi:hypothetical protein
MSRREVKGIVRAFEFGGVTIGLFDLLYNKLEARQVLKILITKFHERSIKPVPADF